MKLIFCIPGISFSKTFLACWTRTLAWCHDNGIEYDVSITYVPIVYHARNQLLGGTRHTPKSFKPFGGHVKYDWIIWIDSDQVWTEDDLAQLLTNPDHKIVTGMVLMHNNVHFNISAYSDEAIDKRRWITREDVNFEGERFTTPECGMGFMAVQYGVLEDLEYPWFSPTIHEDDEMLWFEAEDGSFCNRVTAKGYQIWVDPKIQVGHEKSWVLIGPEDSGLPT